MYEGMSSHGVAQIHVSCKKINKYIMQNEKKKKKKKNIMQKYLHKGNEYISKSTNSKME